MVTLNCWCRYQIFLCQFNVCHLCDPLLSLPILFNLLLYHLAVILFPRRPLPYLLHLLLRLLLLRSITCAVLIIRLSPCHLHSHDNGYSKLNELWHSDDFFTALIYSSDQFWNARRYYCNYICHEYESHPELGLPPYINCYRHLRYLNMPTRAISLRVTHSLFTIAKTNSD